MIQYLIYFILADEDNFVAETVYNGVNDLEALMSDHQLAGLSCSDLVSIFGLIHSGHYGYAALLLGISAPVAFTVPFLVGVVWTIGGVIGCNL